MCTLGLKQARLLMTILITFELVIGCNFSAKFIDTESIIVGGIGDSGTRGIRYLLESLGLPFCPPHGKSGDDEGVQVYPKFNYNFS